MVWCPMITAQYVIAQRVVGRALAPERRTGLERYFLGPRAADGGWGLHPEAPGSVFVTALVYVALRLLGLGRDEPVLKDARHPGRGKSRRPEFSQLRLNVASFRVALCG